MKTLWLALVAVLLTAVPSLGQTAPVLQFIGFSTKMPPGDSLAFRKAIDCALDREAIAKAVSPFARPGVVPKPATSISHPSLPGFDPSVKGCGYDIAKAKEFFTQSGWSGGITILSARPTNQFLETYFRAVAGSIQQSLGVAVTYQPVTNFNTLVAAAKNGSAPVWMFAWGADPRDFGYPSFPLGIGRELLNDPELTPLIEAKNSALAEKMIIDKALIVPVIYF